MTQTARIFLLILVVCAWYSPAHAQTLEARDNFAKAYALYSNGEHGQAKELFQKTVEAKFRLTDYSLYYLASIAVKEANWGQARQYLSELRQGYPRSVWSDAVRLQRAKIDLAEKQNAQAADALRRLRSDKAVKREISDEARYLEAQTQEALGNPSAAHALYQELRNVSPTSRWSAAARKDVSRLRDKHPDLFPFHTIESLSEEAERLVRERQTTDAATLYKRLLNNATDSDSRLRYLSKLADLYLTTRNRSEAVPLFEQIAREYSDTQEAPKALYQIGQIHWNRHDNAQALEYFKMLLEKYPTSAPIDRAKFALADIHEYFGRKDQAIELYIDVRKKFPHSQVRDDAGWRLAWLYYRSGDLPAAREAFRELAAQSKSGSFTTAATYWQGRVAEQSGDAETAKQIYRQIFNAGEESYYQALSLRSLERLGAAVEEPKSAKPVAANEQDPPMAPEATFHIGRARELAALSLHRLAVIELDALQRNAKIQGRLRSLLMREYFLNRAYGQSLQLASQLPVGQSERNLYRYPLAFWDLVQQKAQERDLDPYLILALIRQESLFDARARSPAAAYGLMQLISPTAARVAKQLGRPPPSPEQLFEPEINVTLGTEYLKDLLQRYSNNWFKAVAAYNAGEAAVDRWEREIATDDIEEFVERIPYIETRGYVKLVLRNHRIYKRLYEANNK